MPVSGSTDIRVRLIFMFTGIIEEVGVVAGLARRAAGSRLRIASKRVTEDLREGDSIAVSGVCLTAVEPSADSFAADVSPETLERSALGGLRQGSRVNLERSLTPSARLGGHIVQGHVDGTGEVAGLDLLGDNNWWLTVRVPRDLDRYLVLKGSVSIDGISLTVAALEDDLLSVAVIPHTFENTTLRDRRPGDVVNLEVDILAKYVEKMLAAREQPKSGLTEEKLRELGY